MYHSINPFSKENIQNLAFESIESLNEKLIRSDSAYKNWRKYSINDRKPYFKNLISVLTKEKELLAREITLEMGKPLLESIAEIDKCIGTTEWYLNNVDAIIQQHLPTVSIEHIKSQIAFEPIGAVLGIMPWNFPYWQVFRYAIPTLLIGNTVLLKHAPNVPGCAQSLEKIFKLAGFPDDLFLSLYPAVEDIEYIIASPAVQAVTVTGSERAGRSVASLAGKHLKKCVLELGGSDPFIVLADAPIKQTVAEAIKGRLQNNGQSCIAAKRFIIHEQCYDAFLTELKEQLNARIIGDPMLKETHLGPMARADLKEQLSKQVQSSVAAGADCTYKHPFDDSNSNFFSPLILENIPANSPARAEELFGPVFSCIRVTDTNEAIAVANETRFGLGASIWSNTITEAEKLSQHIEAGSVFINGITRSDARLPFGGIKQSGFGRELSVFGLQEFVNVKTYWVNEQ
jgi:succinate-semialdehyde dehydrogenase/glutarate-semialdehyde dehydrogenase